MWKSVTTLIWLSLTSAVWAAKDPEAGSYYPQAQLGIKKIDAAGAKLEIVFKPRAERDYWCPGVKVKTTKKATIVTFVRCKNSKDCSVDRRAKIGKKLLRTVTVDTRGLDTYIKNGPKSYKRIHEAPKKKAQTVKKAKQPAQSTTISTRKQAKSQRVGTPSPRQSWQRTTPPLPRPPLDIVPLPRSGSLLPQ